MPEPTPDPAKTASLTQQIVKILAKEDSPTRLRAIEAALTILGEVQVKSVKDQKQEGSGAGGGHDDSNQEGGHDHAHLAAFFQRDGDLKPSDHMYLCAAYLYSLYGIGPFSLDELRQIGSEAGVVLPDRLDMTLKQASNKGKKLFQSAGRDAYKPTASAGVLFKEKWNVKPGKKPKPVKETK